MVSLLELPLVVRQVQAASRGTGASIAMHPDDLARFVALLGAHPDELGHGTSVSAEGEVQFWGSPVYAEPKMLPEHILVHAGAPGQVKGGHTVLWPKEAA